MIEIKKEIVLRLRKFDRFEDFDEPVSVELTDGTIIENVLLRNVNFKREKESIYIKMMIEDYKDDENIDIFPFMSRKVFESNRIGIDNVKRIFESSNKIPKTLFDFLGGEDFTTNDYFTPRKSHVYSVKLGNRKNYNFRIYKGDKFLDFPENYKFKDFGKIKKDKVYFNSKTYTYDNDKIRRNINVIKFYESPMIYECYIDVSEHFWRNKTSHNTS